MDDFSSKLAVIHSRQDTKQRLKYIKEELN